MRCTETGKAVSCGICKCFACWSAPIDPTSVVKQIMTKFAAIESLLVRSVHKVKDLSLLGILRPGTSRVPLQRSLEGRPIVHGLVNFSHL